MASRFFVRGAIVMLLLGIASGLPSGPAMAEGGNSIAVPDADQD